MILYLQKNFDGSFAISEKNNNKDEVFNFDYITLIDNISKDTRYIDIVYFAKEIFNCKKLIIDF